MKNIAIIIPNLQGGGAERVAALLSQELSRNYNVYLIVFNAEDNVYSYGGKLIDIKTEAHPNYFMKIINVMKRIYIIRKIKKKYNISTTISFLNGPNIVNILSKVEDKILISVHSHLSKGGKSRFKNINSFINNKSDEIISVSKGVANDLVINYGLKKELISCIYNPVNIEEIERLSTESINHVHDENFTGFIISTMGRLTYAKGHWHLIRSLVEVKKEIEDFKLLILGQGELEEYLKQLVIDLKLEEHVTFLGFQKNPFKYIYNSDLFVSSSLYEGFPNSIIEAMACGAPIISTDCRSGPREMLAPSTEVSREAKKIEYAEYGILLPVCDGNYYHKEPLTVEERLLAKSILKVYHNKKVRRKYSNSSFARAKDFKIDYIIKEWEQLI